MKKLLLLFLSVALLSCGKDDPKPEDVKPKVESVTFAEVFTGTQSNTKLFIKLSIPEAGSVKSVTILRNSTRINSAIMAPVNGTNTFVDPMGFPSASNPRTYKMILILKDDTEINSQTYQAP